MARARQELKIISNKYSKPKGIWINRHSIGTIWINGIPHTYNPQLVYRNEVDVDKIVEDSQPKKKIILIKRK